MGSQFLQKNSEICVRLLCTSLQEEPAVLDPVVQPIIIIIFLLSHIFASSTPLTSNCLSLFFGTWEGLGDESFFYSQEVGTWRGLFLGGSCRVLLDFKRSVTTRKVASGKEHEASNSLSDPCQTSEQIPYHL